MNLLRGSDPNRSVSTWKRRGFLDGALAGDTTGCSTSTSKDTSTASIGSWAPVQDGGRQRRAANCGDAARWGDKPNLGEPVPALRLRHVDGAELSPHPVRAVRGRRNLSPQERRGGAGWPTASRSASWYCIRRRRRSSIARMRTGVAIFRTSRSTFSSSHSEQERWCGKELSPRMASCPQ